MGIIQSKEENLNYILGVIGYGIFITTWMNLEKPTLVGMTDFLR